MAEAKKTRGFGINADTKSSNNLKMLPPIKLDKPTPQFPSGYKFPVAYLVNIVANDAYETKNGDKTVLQFVFRDAESRQFIHFEWAIEEDDEKYDKKIEAMNSRVKHILDQVGVLPEGKEIGTEAENFFQYFEAIRDTFKEINPSFSKVPMYVKLTYGQNNNLQFPYAPNFVQVREKDKPCKLEINLTYDTIEQDAGGSIPGAPSMSGGNSPGHIPSFDKEYD